MQKCNILNDIGRLRHESYGRVLLLRFAAGTVTFAETGGTAGFDKDAAMIVNCNNMCCDGYFHGICKRS